MSVVLWICFIGVLYFLIGMFSIHWHLKYLQYLTGRSYYQLRPIGKALLFLLFPRACIRMKSESAHGDVFSGYLLIKDQEYPIAALCVMFWPIHWLICKPLYIVWVIMAVQFEFLSKLHIVQVMSAQCAKIFSWCADCPMEFFVKSTFKQQPSVITTVEQEEDCGTRTSLEEKRIRISTELAKLTEEQGRVEEEYAELLARQELEVQAVAGNYRG